MDTSENIRESNYDVFKKDALRRFLTYDQDKLIRRLTLKSDEKYIYIPFFGREYRMNRQEPEAEYRDIYPGADPGADWKEANSNAVLTLCDLLCHTDEPISLSGTYLTLEGLNRVKGGNGGVLGNGFYQKTAEYFDLHLGGLKRACEVLGGIPAGKGDAAYCLPLFGSFSMQLSYYQSDDEFPAQLTFFYDQNICNYLFYETLWYLNNLILDMLKELIDSHAVD